MNYFYLLFMYCVLSANIFVGVVHAEKAHLVFHTYRKAMPVAYRSNFLIDEKELPLPRVLHVALLPISSGSIEVVFSICKYLYENGFDNKILVTTGSILQKKLNEAEIPHYSTNALSVYAKNKYYYKKKLGSMISKICLQHNIEIIHTHKPLEYFIARDIAQKYGIAIIAHYHTYTLPSLNKFKGFDAFIGVSPRIIDYVTEVNKTCNLGIKHIGFMYPPYDDQKFLNFKSAYSSKADFFKKCFNIEIGNDPVVCMVANYYESKNHELLLEAVSKLVKKGQGNLHIMLAGTGKPNRYNTLKTLVENLHLEQNVHFLGFINNVEELFYFSDLSVLPSLFEAFGIVLLEAALMKKPIILSKTADAANVVIFQDKTGLLCDPENVDDLADKIQRILKNPREGKRLGENAYNYVKENFLSQCSLDSLIDLYFSLKIQRNQ